MPVNNYIDQSQELALCIFSLAPLLLIQRGWGRAPIGALMAAMFCDLMFVAVARTALLYISVLAILFSLRYLSTKNVVLFFILSFISVSAVWLTSPYLRERYEFTLRDYKLNQTTDMACIGYVCAIREYSKPLYGDWPWVASCVAATLFMLGTFISR